MPGLRPRDPRTYAFVSRWTVPASCAECWALLERGLRPGPLPWWPAVRVEAAPRPPAEGGVVDLTVHSPVGYRLRVGLTLTEVTPPHVIAATSAGDLVGRGVLALSDGSAGALLTWTWEVEVRRPWMRRASPALRPVFEAAHRTVMRRGERGFARLLSGPHTPG